MEMEWGYGSGSKKVHCFKPMEDPNLNVSVCKKIITFNVEPMDEDLEKPLNVCFTCLSKWILLIGGEK